MEYFRYLGWRPVAVLAAVLGAYLLACLGLWRFQTKMIFFPPQSVGAAPTDVGLSYEDLYLPVGDGQVHGWWIPAPAAITKAPVIIYAHGNASNLSDLVSRFQQFHDWGYAVMAVDYRGYGKSSGPFPNEQQVYEDIEAAWQYLIRQQEIAPGRIVIYGQSIGGAIALNLAIDQPEAAGLIMESSFTSMREMVDHRFPLLAKAMPIDSILTQQFNSVEKMRSLQIPLLLIHGTDDDIVPVTMSQQLYGETIVAGKTSSRLIMIDEGDHNNLPTAGGDTYVGSIQAFVESQQR
ncbi:alpha/beta hydrolase [cf. Phormidesmis sp. LEGE 11477]|uniref:alpha/beta hydrolase n=1 Tax=cf. Phormidesmis sp. LEGE 11477 TaxID=1828680 RepID=UPI0018820229|nr:alpha/beta fold hydrolase [cf. Phormidesmis sp. LEGE 11477]MBE9064036.1 alpha/beta fold hydrolase [cf. Phormidesmis sp. LEGE 11477]